MKRTYGSGRYIAKILLTQSVYINKRPEAVTKKCRDGAGMAQWLEHSPPTNMARVRFPHPASYVS